MTCLCSVMTWVGFSWVAPLCHTPSASSLGSFLCPVYWVCSVQDDFFTHCLIEREWLKLIRHLSFLYGASLGSKLDFFIAWLAQKNWTSYMAGGFSQSECPNRHRQKLKVSNGPVFKVPERLQLPAVDPGYISFLWLEYQGRWWLDLSYFAKTAL